MLMELDIKLMRPRMFSPLFRLVRISKYSDIKLFELIITVPGVGPRTAIAIFSNGTGDEITKAIIDADVTFFSGIPRLGTKNAQKIIIELKNKVGGRELDLAGV